VPAITADRLAQVERQFTGPMRQVPPMYSALKKDGKALYEYARAGQEVEREARDVVIRELRLAPDLACGPPNAIGLVAKVSKGTYIRTLGEAIGEALGCGGHLTALRRTATGHFEVAQCVTLQALEAMTEDERLACLKPVGSLLPDHARIELDAENAGRFLSGLRRRGAWPDCEQAAVFGPVPSPDGGPPCLLGTAHVKGGELIPGRLLSPQEITQILESTS
jgi:tRNA pseudouridine55 synthase